jgi:2-polyprenyl-3-methyl-5-hydroxy-6-metoxy-1,4-benzoquinol methylase
MERRTRVDPDDSMTNFTCRLCRGTAGQTIPAVDAKAGGPLPITMCLDCGLVQQTTLPSSEELRIYYSHHYRQDYKSTYVPKLKHVRRAGQAALSRLAFLRRSAGLAAGARLLDIGAGGGEFVYLAGRAGFQAQGIEPNVGYSEYAKTEYGVDIRTMPVDDLTEASADLVTLFHVFEHIAEPLAVMAKIHGVLAEEGRLLVEVPNILQKDASPHNIYFKAHLFYYSRFTLIAAASRWFEPVEVEDRGNLRVLFRRRAIPLPAIELPDERSIGSTRQRLADKGWIEYAFAGGGLLKPLRRMRRIFAEAMLPKGSPKDLLDRLAVDAASAGR